MKIRLKGSKLELTSSIKDYALKRIGSLEKFLKRFEDEGEPEVEIELARTTQHHKSGEIYYAEATLDLKSKGQKIRAESKEQDIRVAIDGLKDTLKRKILKRKEKKVDKKRKMERPNKPKN